MSKAGWFCGRCALEAAKLVTAPAGVEQPACPRCGSKMKRTPDA